MKKNTTKLLAMLLLIALSAVALSACGIVTNGEFRFGMAIVETAKGQAAAAVILDSNDKVVLARVDAVDTKREVTSSYKKLGKDTDAIKAFERSLVGKSADDIAKLTGEADFVKAALAATLNAMVADSFSSTVDSLAISLNLTAEHLNGSSIPTVVASANALSRSYTVASKSAFYDPQPHNYKLGLASFKTAKGEVGAAVLVDEAGRIALVRIDELDFSGGKTDSKKAQGDSYGMVAWGGAIAEWDDQIAHLETNFIGRDKNTLSEAANTKGHATDVDISAGCTIGINNYIAAVSAAIDNALASNESYTATASEITLSLSYTATAGDAYTVSAKANAKIATKSAEKSLTSVWVAAVS